MGFRMTILLNKWSAVEPTIFIGIVSSSNRRTICIEIGFRESSLHNQDHLNPNFSVSLRASLSMQRITNEYTGVSLKCRLIKMVSISSFINKLFDLSFSPLSSKMNPIKKKKKEE